MRGRAGSKRVRALPYAYLATGLRTSLTQVLLDGGAWGGLVDSAAREVDLGEQVWSHVALEGEVVVDAALLERVVPAEERHAPPLGVVLALRCPATRLRQGFVVSQPGAPALGTHRFTLSLPREQLAGAVELVPFLVRAVTSSVPQARYARSAGARVAGGRGWTLRVDPAMRRRGHLLDVRFARFSESPFEHLRAAERALHVLEADLDEPVLWLNEDHALLAEILASEGTTGARARVRDVVFDRIAASVWTQLFVHATLDVDEDGETMYGWGRGVLDELLPTLLPQLSSDEERRAHLLAARSDPAELSTLLQRLDVLLQSRDQAVEHLQRLLGELDLSPRDRADRDDDDPESDPR